MRGPLRWGLIGYGLDRHTGLELRAKFRDFPRGRAFEFGPRAQAQVALTPT